MYVRDICCQRHLDNRRIPINQNIFGRLVNIQFEAHQQDCFDDGELDMVHPRAQRECMFRTFPISINVRFLRNQFQQFHINLLNLRKSVYIQEDCLRLVVPPPTLARYWTGSGVDDFYYDTLFEIDPCTSTNQLTIRSGGNTGVTF